MGAALRAIAADAEEDVDSIGLQEVNRHLGRLGAARCAQNRPALFLDVFNKIGGDVDQRVGGFWVETFVAVTDSAHGGDAVIVVKRQKDRAHHIVDAGTKAAAGYNGGLDLFGAEKNVFARPGFLKERIVNGRFG